MEPLEPDDPGTARDPAAPAGDGDPADPVERWLAALEARHLADLTFPEVRRALQALSALYVEGRQKLPEGAALEGRGKRAAFALFYGPLHFLTVRRILQELARAGAGARERGRPRRVHDLGCGTGAAGAAWALACGAEIRGVDRSGWAVGEAAWTWRVLGVRGTARRGDLTILPRDIGPTDALVLGWAVNELDDAARGRLLPALLEAAHAGARVLVVEPIARRPVPWWRTWSEAFLTAGGRDETWRFAVTLPEPLRRLDRAAGLDHGTLTARSLSHPAV